MLKNVKVTLDRVADVTRALRTLAEARVMVGIPSDKVERKRDVGEEPIGNAALGYIHENGAPEVNIPARPFLIPGVKADRANTLKWLKEAGRASLEGRVAAVDKCLHAVGLSAQNAVRRQIQSGQFVPLRPRTIARRRRKGRTGTRPLIDTGQLRNAITYVIRRGVKK